MFTSLHLRLICFLALLFYVVCFKLSDNSLLDKTCRKRLTAYLPSLNFSCLFLLMGNPLSKLTSRPIGFLSESFYSALPGCTF